MKPTAKEIVAAVQELAILKYFPPEDGARKAIMRLLERMVDTKPHLDMLVRRMIDQVGEWRGPVELRGVLCSFCVPRDGIEADCEHGPFSHSAMEGRAFDEHLKTKQLGAGESLALLPAVRRMQ